MMILYRVETAPREHLDDASGRKTAAKIADFLGLQIADLRICKVYTVEGLSEVQAQEIIAKGVWHDPVLQQAGFFLDGDADWYLETGFRPGVTDNEGRTARDSAALVLGLKRDTLAVYTSTQYRFKGKLTKADVEHIARDLLCNELIQRFEIKSKDEWAKKPGFTPRAARVSGVSSDVVEIIPLSSMNDEAMLDFSKKNTLALNLEEMQAIKAYFAKGGAARSSLGLPADPTDAEVEVLAQTWSEHCKHKIFSAKISYENTESGTRDEIKSLYKTCIQEATKIIRERLGERDFCRSVFKDNAGVIAFTNKYDVCIKVETHNSPSALDPYGGALTGIVGVNRDPMGTGLGAELVCNMDVFCFASPFYEGELPPRLLHPRRVLEGVREGVEHGGNKSGIPTVNGSIVFDERYLGKPLVYCGTVGIIPREVAGRPGWSKKAEVGDHIVMVGGRIGKDGIHGATFSSEELHEGSPATAVQIGDPITQRKMYDFIMRVRDLGLYSAITDNGAGGLSSSVGEMAQDTGGCKLDLALAPLKYDGLRPWEILLSEAQERMTLAVPPAHLAEFIRLATEMDVEAVALGHFTDSGFMEVCYNSRPVALLGMDFLHDGVPAMELCASWKAPVFADERLDLPEAEQGDFLKRMLGRLNICSKEEIIRQYDHEVRGGSAVKPLVGVLRDGPADAAVLRPVLESDAGIVLAHGICPKFSDYDTYWMMANAIDEAVRNAVAVGADPKHMAGVDNFCWCDPVYSDKTPDGHYKLAQLARSCLALRHFCLAYGLPCVSGKDSMKNDYSGGGQKISIPPTVLFSVLGSMRNVVKAQTSDFKNAGDYIYILGGTWRELGGSEAASELGITCANVPHVEAQSAMSRYERLHAALDERLISACHDLSDGGLAVALAEMCIGGRLGAKVDLVSVPKMEDMSLAELLYSESASRFLISVRPDNAAEVERLFKGNVIACIGKTREKPTLLAQYANRTIFDLPVEDLAESFKSTFRDL